LDHLVNREDCTIVQRVDMPTAEQVAVIWVNDEGEAPDVRGILLLLSIILLLLLLHKDSR